jgi:glycerol kinase
MTAPLLLAIDQGTTSSRAIVFDASASIVAVAQEEFPQIYRQAGWVEHDPEEIWATTRRTACAAVLRAEERGGRVVAIGVTNQRETTLVWDRKTLKPVHNAIVWQDRRTTPRCEALRKRGLSREIHRKTGLVIDPYFSATKIEWLLDHVKGARRRAERGDLMAGTIDSWILWKLSGCRTHATDTSNASRTMLFNIVKKNWDEGLCRIFRVPQAILPEIVVSSGPVGMVDRSLFGAEIPVTGIVGDQQAALFGQGCVAPGLVKNTYGTGLFALENTGPRPRFSKDILTTIAWSIGNLEETEYAVEGSVFIAGAAIQWLRDGLQLLKSAKETEAIAKSLTSNEGVYFVPALVGLGAPHWDSRARGTIIGITRGTTRAHFVAAALEAIAYQTKDILEILQKETGVRLKALRVDGGASANDFLMQFQSDILGIPVERPKILEVTALGAAGLAGIAAGLWKGKEEFNRLRRIDRVFRPRMKRAEARRLHAKWQEAVLRSKAWADQ